MIMTEGIHSIIIPQHCTDSLGPPPSSSPSCSSIFSSMSTTGRNADHGTIEDHKINQTTSTCKEHSSMSTTNSTCTISSSNSVSVVETEKKNDDDVRGYFETEVAMKMNERAKKENSGLNLNLGIPIDLTVFTSRHSINIQDGDCSISKIAQKIIRLPIQTILHLFDRLFSLVEHPLFKFWSFFIPLRFRQKLTFLGWGLYFPIHKFFIGRRSGVHKNVSMEYHALTSVMWWGRLFPITIQRMRFSLSQLHVCHPPTAYPKWDDAPSKSKCTDIMNNGDYHGVRGHVHEIYHEMTNRITSTGTKTFNDPMVPKLKLTRSEMTVTGLYLQHSSRPSEKVIFWIYGGAFLAGDSRGNLGIAEKMGMLCGADRDGEMRDIFIPDYRLVPEYHLDDAVHDVTLAYEYLIYERGILPENVTLLGISSGGGLVVLVLQALAKSRRAYEDGKIGSYVPMPAGGVLMCPFVDYTEPKGSMREYIKHDLIVNQAVYEEGIPYLEKVLGCHENRVRASPCYCDFYGLPPLCICVSQHEIVYDQTMLLAKRAEDHGVDVTVGVWKYMCHVFPMLCAFIPEGRASFKFMCDWIKDH
mmetsp:Transcript_27311/g.57480  ORF Transcript_27311/g.57480 Transcript_27311/m.57480 type:complete len:584 (-) Transcript_27311:117-1868(-)